MNLVLFREQMGFQFNRSHRVTQQLHGAFVARLAIHSEFELISPAQRQAARIIPDWLQPGEHHGLVEKLQIQFAAMKQGMVQRQ